MISQAKMTRLMDLVMVSIELLTAYPFSKVGRPDNSWCRGTLNCLTGEQAEH